MLDRRPSMKLAILMAIFAIPLGVAGIALAGDCTDADDDLVCDTEDNCIDPLPSGDSAANMAQDDTDGDSCGNVCDPDLDQNGVVGHSDVIVCINSFVTPPGNPNCDLTEPIGNRLSFADVIKSIRYLGFSPGRSGTTPGTVACPL